MLNKAICTCFLASENLYISFALVSNFTMLNNKVTSSILTLSIGYKRLQAHLVDFESLILFGIQEYMWTVLSDFIRDRFDG